MPLGLLKYANNDYSVNSEICTGCHIDFFQAPISVAVLVILVSLFLSITPIVTAPSLKYLLALLMVVVGVILYIFFVYKDNRPKCMSKLATHGTFLNEAEINYWC